MEPIIDDDVVISAVAEEPTSVAKDDDAQWLPGLGELPTDAAPTPPPTTTPAPRATAPPAARDAAAPTPGTDETALPTISDTKVLGTPDPPSWFSRSRLGRCTRYTCEAWALFRSHVTSTLFG